MEIFKTNKIIYLLLFGLICCFQFTACNQSSKHTTPIWDPESSLYKIPDKGLVYNVENGENIIVGVPEDLPPQVLMCIVDTASNICSLLLNLDYAPTSTDLAQNVVKEIVMQNNSTNTRILNQYITPCVYLDTLAWSFNSNLRIPNNKDTLDLIYTGYIFSDMALVVTAEKSVADSTKIADLLHALQKKEL